jgi:hypothetical protein
MVTETGTGVDAMSNTGESVVLLLFSRRRLNAPGAAWRAR